MLRVGSPPLARERPISLYSLLLSSRITPARAGKTKKNKYILAETRDHPRSRGKDDIVDRMSATVQGSPPLARERPGSDPRPAACPGITPARAGKTNPFALLWCKSWDHPRSRGKDIPDAASPVWYQGSPPLARERLIRSLCFGVKAGITPARAGKTSPMPHRQFGIRDHPRSRGKD